eukprot:TRINITY_DN20050_c0_g1_i1.p1 TRINITY_DN20050_c0_g1~~TRINITY_DN20050_c0_g1_i1.p1  ORF type:complete len:129 (+),score=36.97 TRINITY_DN20050_c0_g1_i1:30-389(+)
MLHFPQQFRPKSDTSLEESLLITVKKITATQPPLVSAPAPVLTPSGQVVLARPTAAGLVVQSKLLDACNGDVSPNGIGVHRLRGFAVTCADHFHFFPKASSLRAPTKKKKKKKKKSTLR